MVCLLLAVPSAVLHFPPCPCADALFRSPSISTGASSLPTPIPAPSLAISSFTYLAPFLCLSNTPNPSSSHILHPLHRYVRSYLLPNVDDYGDFCVTYTTAFGEGRDLVELVLQRVMYVLGMLQN